jgi:hypothetical protein
VGTLLCSGLMPLLSDLSLAHNPIGDEGKPVHRTTSAEIPRAAAAQCVPCPRKPSSRTPAHAPPPFRRASPLRSARCRCATRPMALARIVRGGRSWLGLGLGSGLRVELGLGLGLGLANQ